MSDMEVRPLPGQDVVVIAPAGTTFAKPSINGTKTRIRAHNTGTLPVEPPPVEPPPTGKVVRFPAGGLPSSLVTLARDLTVDVIEMEVGVYSRWSCFLDVARPADRPLLIRPAPGAAVVWDGTGMGNTPPWYIGRRSLTSYVTLDPAGTGGSFTIQNYTQLAEVGIVLVNIFDHVAFNGVRVRNCNGTVSPQTTHVVYISSSNEQTTSGQPQLPRSKYWESNGWDVEGPANRYLSGLHIFHTPNADHITARDWNVANLHRWVYAYGDPTDVIIDGWTGRDSNATIDNWWETAQGVVSNCKAVRSGPIAPGFGSWQANGRLISGGGNTAS